MEVVEVVVVVVVVEMVDVRGAWMRLNQIEILKEKNHTKVY